MLRRVRLEALADAPTAFSTTLAEASVWTEDRWRDRARGSATSRLFLAFVGEEAVGMAGLFDEGERSAQLISVWVRPEHRGRGAARALTMAALDLANGAGMARVTLWVTNGNASARGLYEHLGFRPTGNHQPVPSRSSLEEHEMEIRVAPSVPAPPAGD